MESVHTYGSNAVLFRKEVHAMEEAPGYNPWCGLDVHKDVLVAAFGRGATVKVKEYGTTTGEIQRLADELKAFGRRMLTTESTGPYWVSVWSFLEGTVIPRCA